MQNKDNTFFREVQHFRNPYLYLIIICCFIYALVFLIGQINIIKPSGNDSSINIPHLIMTLPGVIIPVILFWFYYVFELQTEVRNDGLYMLLRPINRSFIKYNLLELDLIQTRTSIPAAEYVFWRFYHGAKSFAYHVSGNQGVHLVFSNDRHILIGSKRVDELGKVIHHVHNKLKGSF